MEEWKDIYFEENGVIYDYRGLYQVSSEGKVKSLNYNGTGQEKVLKARYSGRGYLQVGLYKNRKRNFFYVHRLVAQMFIENDNPLIKTDINHIDEDKTNNSVENLEWCTHEYNLNHGTRTKRASDANKGKFKGENNPRCRKVILLNTGEIFDYMKQASEKYGASQSDICSCCRGRLKSAGKDKNKNKLVWMYLEDFLKMIWMYLKIIRMMEKKII